MSAEPFTPEELARFRHDVEDDRAAADAEHRNGRTRDGWNLSLNERLLATLDAAVGAREIAEADADRLAAAGFHNFDDCAGVHTLRPSECDCGWGDALGAHEKAKEARR